MIEDDICCMDVLHQTYAVRKEIEKLETRLVESHLQMCVPEGLADGKRDQGSQNWYNSMIWRETADFCKEKG